MAGFLSGAKNLFGGSKKKESGGGGGGVLDMLGGGGDGGMLEILADTATKTDSDGKIAVSDVTGSLVKSGFKENDSGIMDMIKGVISSGGGGSSGGESKLSAGGVKSLLSKIPPSLYKDAAMRKVFRQFDKDNSGTVDKAEMGQIMSKLGKTVEGQSDKVVSMVDKDESQTIEYEELIGRINAITG